MAPKRTVRSRRVGAISTTTTVREAETTATTENLVVSMETLLLTLLTELDDEIRHYLATNPTAIDPAVLAQWRTRVRAFANRSVASHFLFPALRPFLHVGATVDELATLHSVLHRTLTTRLDIPSVQSRLLTLLQEGETNARTRERVSRQEAVDTIVQQSTTGSSSADEVRRRLDHLTTSDVLLVAAVRGLVAQQTRDGVLWSLDEWRQHLLPLHPSFRLLLDVQPFEEMRERARFSPFPHGGSGRATDVQTSVHATLVLAGLPLPPQTLLQFAQTTLLFPSVDIAVRHFATQHRLDGFWNYIQTNGPQDLTAWSQILKWPLQSDPFFRGRGPFRHRVFPWQDLLTLPVEEWTRLMDNPFTRSSPESTTAFVRRWVSANRPAKTMRRTAKTTTGRHRHVSSTDVGETVSDDEEASDDEDAFVDDLEAFLPQSENQQEEEEIEKEEAHGDALTWVRHVMAQEEQEVVEKDDSSASTVAATRPASSTTDDRAPLRIVVRLPDGGVHIFRVSPKTVLRAILLLTLERAALPPPRGKRRYVLKQRGMALRLERTLRDLHLVSGTVLQLDTVVPPSLYTGPAVKSLITQQWHGRVRLGWRILLLQTRPWIPHYHYSLLVPTTTAQATRDCVGTTGVVGKPCHPSAAFFRTVAETPWAQQEQEGHTFHCGPNAFRLIHVLTDGTRVPQTPAIFQAEQNWCANELERFLRTPFRGRLTLERVGEQPFASLDTDTAAALLALLRQEVAASLQRWMPSRNMDALVDTICASTAIDGSILHTVRQTAALLVWIDPASPLVDACPTMRARLVNYALQLDRLLPLCASGPSRRLWSFVFPEIWDLPVSMCVVVKTLLHEWVRSKALRLWAKFTSDMFLMNTSMLATQVLLSAIKAPELSAAVRQALVNVGRQPPSTHFPITFVDANADDAPPRQSENVSALAERWIEDDRREDLPADFGTFFDCLFAQYGGGVDDTWAAFEEDPYPERVSLDMDTPTIMTTTLSVQNEPVEAFRPDFFTVLRAAIAKRKSSSST